MCVVRLQSVMDKAPAYLKKKPDVSRVEQTSERAAMCWHLGQELLSQVPIKPAVLKAEWYDAWKQGSEHVDLELQALALEKTDDFNVVKHVGVFKKLIEQHIMSAPIPSAVDPCDADKLEVDKFGLLMNQIKYDEFPPLDQ